MSATWLNDLKNGIITTSMSLDPAVRTATANGTGVDLLGAEGWVSAILNVGTVTGTTPTLDVKLQESDDNSTFSDISGAAFTQVTATPSPATTISVLTTHRRAKRYVRAVATIGGTTPSFPCAVTIMARKKIVGSGTGTYVGF